MLSNNILRFLAPLGFAASLLVSWEVLTSLWNIPPWMLPAPSRIGAALLTNFHSLMSALGATFYVTIMAFISALISGLVFAILFTHSRLMEATFHPWLVTLQVTPVIAIAPLILIWVGIDNPQRALIIIAWIIAFFPVVTSAIGGMRSIPTNLRDLFKLYHVGWWHRLWHLELPAATAQILSGAKIASGLSLIGAITAEFVAGSGASRGLGWRIIEASNRLQTDTLFASLLLLSLLGVTIFYTLSLIEWLLLRHWHPKYK